jgi:hypothetical protein
MKNSQTKVAGVLVLAGAAFACGTSGSGQPDSGTDASSGNDSASADASTDAAQKPARPTNAYNLGMNAPSLNYYNNVAIYADMALAIAGNNGPWDNGNVAAPLDGTGAPTVAATSAVTADYPTGNYTVTWDGTGSISISGGPTIGAVTTTMTGSVQHNTATMSFQQKLSTQTSAAWYPLKATPPITNIHIMADPSLAFASGMFMQDFATRMHPFTTLRFMEALNTNGNLVQNWSQRTWPSQGSRANRPQGMAYEDIIALANAFGVDVWVNVPALATDDYVCRLARLFKYGEQGDMSNSACSTTAPAQSPTTTPLAPQSKVYFEYSNEVWNWGFQQTEDIYCMVWGMPDKTESGKYCDVTAPTSAMGVADLANTSIAWSTNTYAKATQFSVFLTKRVSDITRSVFGCTSGQGCQAQIVMNVQAAYAAEVDPGFALLKSTYGSVSSIIDFMAVAPYFNIADYNTATSVDAVFAGLDATLVTSADAGSDTIASWLGADLAEANMYGLPIIAYEGGQGLNGQTNETTWLAAENDPRMYQAYLTYFAVWDSLIGRSHLFNHFDYAGSAGSYGEWGALINQDDPGSQKWDALLSLTSFAGDANLDGVVNAKDCAIVNASYGMSTNVWWMQGDFNHDGVVNDLDLALMNTNISGPACTH